jgi:hypothetical protein
MKELSKFRDIQELKKLVYLIPQTLEDYAFFYMWRPRLFHGYMPYILIYHRNISNCKFIITGNKQNCKITLKTKHIETTKYISLNNNEYLQTFLMSMLKDNNISWFN